MGKFAEYLEKCERHSYVTSNLAACILVPNRNVTSFYIYSVTANLAALILVPSKLDVVLMEKFRDFWHGLQIPN